MPDYYDQILLAMFLVLIAGAVVSIHPLIEVHQGLAGGSLVATFLLYEILFRNPPTEPTTATTAAAVVVGVNWLFTLTLSL